MRKFLVQQVINDQVCQGIYSEMQLISYLDMSDCCERIRNRPLDERAQGRMGKMTRKQFVNDGILHGYEKAVEIAACLQARIVFWKASYNEWAVCSLYMHI